jgi:hypothetical protein
LTGCAANDKEKMQNKFKWENAGGRSINFLEVFCTKKGNGLKSLIVQFTRTQNEKNHRHRVIFDAMTNNGNKPLGFLFHYFLFHYAHFDYTGSAISIRRSARPELLPKVTMARWLGESVVSSALWITDPVKRGLNFSILVTKKFM